MAGSSPAAVSNPAPDEWLTLQQGSKEMKCTVRTLREKINEGELPAYRLGGRVIRIRRSDLEALLRPIGGATAHERLAEHAARVVAGWPPPTGEQLARVAAILRSGGPA
jgi:excisionase family DNA binding protein